MASIIGEVCNWGDHPQRDFGLVPDFSLHWAADLLYPAIQMSEEKKNSMPSDVCGPLGISCQWAGAEGQCVRDGVCVMTERETLTIPQIVQQLERMRDAEKEVQGDTSYNCRAWNKYQITRAIEALRQTR